MRKTKFNCIENIFYNTDPDDLESSTCIKKTECPCVDEKGRTIPQGESVILKCQDW